MGLLSILFGGSKTAEKGVEFAASAAKGVGRFIDEQKFTDQESAEMRLKVGELMVDLVKATADENSVRSVTRRVLAWGIMGTFITFLVLSALMYKIDIGYSQFLLDVATKSYLGEMALGVGGFYFLAHVLRANK